MRAETSPWAGPRSRVQGPEPVVPEKQQLLGEAALEGVAPLSTAAWGSVSREAPMVRARELPVRSVAILSCPHTWPG